MNKLTALIFLLCAAGLAAPFLKSHDAQFYFNRGSDTLAEADAGRGWFFRWDLRSALADFNHCIRLDPNYTEAYFSRAAIESMTGNRAKAIEDYTTLIELNPQDPDGYLARAELEAANHDFACALGDYAKVIRLAPDNRAAYRGRINVMEMQNNYAGAMMERVRMIEDTVPAFGGSFATNRGFFSPRDPGRWSGRFLEQLDRAIESNTNFAWGYYYRGVVESSLTNDWGSALVDFRHCQDFSDDRLKDYAAIQIWAVQARIGEREKADKELQAYCQNRSERTSADWQMHIAEFLLNQISAADFAKAIAPDDTGNEQSEYWYYSGMKRLLAGNKTGASDCFRKSLTTKTRPYAVFLSARGELSSLNRMAADE